MTDVLYDCLDSERLEHESREEAIEEFLDPHMIPGSDASAVIHSLSPIKITRHVREEVTDGFIEREARTLLERAAEDFVEDFGDPDGYDDWLGDAAFAEALPLMTAALRKFYGHGRVWRFEKAGSESVEAEAVERMMRKCRPDWFGEEDR